jgi:hypothetical protein
MAGGSGAAAGARQKALWIPAFAGMTKTATRLPASKSGFRKGAPSRERRISADGNIHYNIRTILSPVAGRSRGQSPEKENI